MNKFSYREMEKAFNKMTLRERFISLGALVICTLSINYFGVLEPGTLKQKKIQISVQKSKQAEKILLTEITTIEHRLKQDPLEEINNKIAFSQITLKRIDEQLEEKLVKFIHAQKMPLALTKVLAQSPGVKISELKSLPVKVFNSRPQSASKSNQDMFYQHTLQITLAGNYNAIYQYLLNVENIQDKFYWQSINYQVSKYPLAEVILQIYTLSDQQDLVSG